MVMLGERWERKGETQKEYYIMFSFRVSVFEMTVFRTGETCEAMMESPCIPAANGHFSLPILPPVESYSQWDTGILRSGLILSESNEVALCHIPLETIRKLSRSHLLKMFLE